jgi:GNAT superfamily N-acetyltransferase
MYKWLVSAARRDGRVMALCSHDQLDGVAVWFPSPKAFPPPWHRALVPALAIMPAYVLEPAAEARNRWLEKFIKQLLGCVDVECVYLAALAVREDRRGAGVGTALVQEGSAWAAREDKRVHLHCWSPLVAYYEQLGFREMCQGTFEGIADTCHGMLSSPDAAHDAP